MPLVQSLFHASNVGLGDGPYTPSGSAVVTAGNDIFVLVAISDPASSWTCIDNLGNVYSLLYELPTPSGAGSNQKLVFFRAPITVGGTLTYIQVDWTTMVTGIAMCSAEFSGAGVYGATTDAGSGSAMTSASVSVAPVSGLLFFNTCIFGQVSGFTPPTGFALADSATVASSSGWQAFMAYKEGSASGTLTATWSTGRAWHAGASDIAIPPPPVSKLSFDGVFVR